MSKLLRDLKYLLKFFEKKKSKTENLKINLLLQLEADTGGERICKLKCRSE